VPTKKNVETVQKELRAAMSTGQEGLRATVSDLKEYIEASHRQLRIAISVGQEERRAKMKAGKE
jgi:hypothetical protein